MQPADYETLTPDQAIAYQNELRQKIRIEPLDKPIRIIGGADISFNKYSEIVYAGIILLKYPEMTVISHASVVSRTSFPYISGLLAFREVPALLEVWNKLDIKPDLLVLDGQGIAHERRLGIATHFGLVTDVPTIGSAKSRLRGKYAEPANEVFAQSPMYDRDEVIGTALRTKRNCNPIFISPGHRISMEQSVEVIKNCIRGYRIPEPTRHAHLLVNKVRVDDSGKDTQFSLF
ncbi:deoxyribonuclease V [Mucilaginibacter polytrichastri]|uniref:Endonuclease V n=1 Tax=Mucilaginibacter polytrichastri TaxID=1302689 RepID=A0A1Q5ZYB7_9SPHI|nr:deoxyribonuclease V [Mucilaginibacter polytrichastri]OKS86760.1 Endonuclease V [Mucilaginibacter polytrichastri]SFT22479.1 Endonuclease V [Mucilaginibacter polytrichastri]